jgi:DDE_Tnp_1-associated
MSKGFGNPIISPQQVREANILERSVLKHFQDITDPRLTSRSTHPLVSIITIAILAVISGADGCVAIETYGKAKQSWLETFLDLPCGM